MRYQSCGTLWFFAHQKSMCQENPVFLPSSDLSNEAFPRIRQQVLRWQFPARLRQVQPMRFLLVWVQGQVHRAFSSRLLVWGQSGRRAQPIPLLFSIRFRPLGHTVLFQQRGRCPAILWDRKNHQAGLFVSQRLRLLDELWNPKIRGIEQFDVSNIAELFNRGKDVFPIFIKFGVQKSTHVLQHDGSWFDLLNETDCLRK